MTSFAMGRFHFILATLSMTSVKYSKESMPLSMQDNASE